MRKGQVNPTYARRKSLGLCINCGVEKVEPPLTRCTDCRMSNNARHKKWRKREKNMVPIMTPQLERLVEQTIKVATLKRQLSLMKRGVA